MRKLILMILLCCAATTYAAKKPSTYAVDFTLSYRPQNSTEHVMKNVVQLTDNKWAVAGKLVKSKSNDVLLFLARMVSHKNNKYKLEFMLIDSGDRSNYITMPKIAAMTGLPVQVAENNIQLNVLVHTP